MREIFSKMERFSPNKLAYAEIPLYNRIHTQNWGFEVWEVTMDFSKEDLAEAKKQIDSTLHKLRETVRTLESKADPERYKSQITLAKRRIKAFSLANRLIESHLEASDPD